MFAIHVGDSHWRLRFMFGDCDSQLRFMLAIDVGDLHLRFIFIIIFFCIVIITLCTNSADDKLIFLFFHKIGIEISFKLSPGGML